MSERRDLVEGNRWVVKIGSTVLTNHGRGLDGAAMDGWVAQIAELKKNGREVILVSSGAVAEGMVRLNWRRRPTTINKIQAAAAVGQMGLVQAYEARFARYGLSTAQVLLTREDVADRARYLNARAALLTLLALGVVPVVNENDTVANQKMRVGDNDTLAALTVNLVDADLLVVMTDQEGLYDADPRSYGGARLIPQARAGDRALEALAGGGSALGRGGMRTKLTAAAWAARSGAGTLIVNGTQPDILQCVAAGEELGTMLLPGQQRVVARKRWIAGQLQFSGRLRLDSGAARVLRESGKSLLPVGVVAVEGEFGRGDVVACLDSEGREIARGLVNYTATEARAIRGRPSQEISGILNYAGEPELIHRDNLVLS